MSSSSTSRSRARLAALALLLALAPEALARTLKVGVSDDYPPFSAGSAGFDVVMAERFAASVGAKIEWVRFRWPELGARLREGAFDVAMSGITWRPERDVGGWMSRAVAVGGPCVVGAAEPKRVAVNRGGILEQFARGRFSAKQLRLIDDNRTLPKRLAKGEVDAVVTDSFERASFPAETPARCEPARDRKVYWVAPARAQRLGHEIDRWLAAEESKVDALRAERLGGAAPWTAADHLVDLLARRLELMPLVAEIKRAGNIPVQDRMRESMVARRMRPEAARNGIEPDIATDLFRTQIRLAVAIQERTIAKPPVPAASKPPKPEDARAELQRVLRPAIDRLDRRILLAWKDALAASPPLTLDRKKLVFFEPLLTTAEIDKQAKLLERALGPKARLRSLTGS